LTQHWARAGIGFGCRVLNKTTLIIQKHANNTLDRCRLLDVGSYVATPPPAKGSGKASQLSIVPVNSKCTRLTFLNLPPRQRGAGWQAAGSRYRERARALCIFRCCMISLAAAPYRGCLSLDLCKSRGHTASLPLSRSRALRGVLKGGPCASREVLKGGPYLSLCRARARALSHTRIACALSLCFSLTAHSNAE
jgi:hypothetical protein